MWVAYNAAVFVSLREERNRATGVGRIPAAVFVSPREETNRMVGGRVGESNDNVPSGSLSDRASLVTQALPTSLNEGRGSGVMAVRGCN